MLVTWFFVKNCIEKSRGGRFCKVKRVLTCEQLECYYAKGPHINCESYKWNFVLIFVVAKDSIAILLYYFWGEIKISTNKVSGTSDIGVDGSRQAKVAYFYDIRVWFQKHYIFQLNVSMHDVTLV